MMCMKRFSIAYETLAARLKDGKPFGLLSQQTSPLGERLHVQFPRTFTLASQGSAPVSVTVHSSYHGSGGIL